MAAALTEHLAQSPVFVVTGFAEQLAWALYRLGRKELGHGLSGDAFFCTRCAVVAAGRGVFEDVLHDPGAFAPFTTDRIWAESLLCIPDHAYEYVTGEEWHRNTHYSYESYSNTGGWAATPPPMRQSPPPGDRPHGMCA